MHFGWESGAFAQGVGVEQALNFELEPSPGLSSSTQAMLNSPRCLPLSWTEQGFFFLQRQHRIRANY